jgi:hypothetical protein
MSQTFFCLHVNFWETNESSAAAAFASFPVHDFPQASQDNHFDFSIHQLL